MRIVLFTILWIIFFSIQCSQKTSEPDLIVAEIGDKHITVNDFRMRTELVPRPKYPALSPDECKRIYINDLIAEKLMAIEGYHGEKEKKLIENEVFKASIQGIREQVMREQLYLNVAVQSVNVNENELKRIFPLAGREYDISFFTIYNDSLALALQELLKDRTQFEAFYRKFSANETAPQKTVKFTDPDPVIVHESLFSKPMEPGNIIGPLRIENDHYLVIRVDDYKDYPAVSDSDVRIRWGQVDEKLREKEAYYTWKQVVSDIMKGKKIEFDPKAFKQMTDLFYHIFNAQDAVKSQLIRKFVDNQGNEIHFDRENIGDLLLDEPFFSLDGTVWTVRDFRNEYRKHPLVLPQQSFTLPTFRSRFRKAIIDMIRDRFLTKEAYKRHLDRSPRVKNAEMLWKDAYVAMYHRDQYLHEKIRSDQFDPERMKGNENYLSVHIDSLQHKYSGKIKIYPDVLDRIRLTELDTYVMNPNVPYPAVVPHFPEYIQDGEFDYGTLIKTKDQRNKKQETRIKIKD
jgi:hypothetical protein